MSSNAKIVLRKKPNSKGLYPLAVRITKNRRSTYQYIGHYIDIEDWDEKNIRVRKSNSNADSLNKLLSQELSNANKALIDLQSEHKDASANQIKKVIDAEMRIKNNKNFIRRSHFSPGFEVCPHRCLSIGLCNKKLIAAAPHK